MALINGRSLTNALKTFIRENGREPNVDEFRNLVMGKSSKKKAQDETEEEKSA